MRGFVFISSPNSLLKNDGEFSVVNFVISKIWADTKIFINAILISLFTILISFLNKIYWLKKKSIRKKTINKTKKKLFFLEVIFFIINRNLAAF